MLNSHSASFSPSEHYDAIVIGSGIGGMSAAGLLARLAGKKVLVLERHFELGGLTHVFRRGGREWDVGLHYVGEMADGSMLRLIMDYLTRGRLQWNRMPPVFERFLYPGLSVEEPSDPAAYRGNLLAAFPGEEKALRKYFRAIAAATRWHTRDYLARFAPAPFSAFLRAINLPGRRQALSTTADVLSGLTRDVRLRAVLASQWGDYGLPPGQSAFAIHALIVSHYLHGAYYPRGGSSRIARLIEPVIEAAGGECRLSHEVQEVLVEGGRAIGVRVTDRNGAAPRELQILAPLVISDAGARNTFLRLLPAGQAAGARRELETVPTGESAVTLYVGLGESPASLGIRGENVWIYSDYDHDSPAQGTGDLMAGRPGSCYLSFPSMKSGDARGHTAEIIAFASASDFARWQGQPWKQRKADYYELKEKISDGLLALVEKHIPGFSRLVTYRELSTPLSIEHFTNRGFGEMYGIPVTPRRYRMRCLRVKTPVRGLLLAGSDVSSLGIAGALMGGVAAAARAVGLGGFMRIVTAARTTAAAAAGTPQPAATSIEERPRDALTAVVISSTCVTETVREIAFRIDHDIPFVPGQYIKLRVGESEWREYSVADLGRGRLTLLIDTRPGGMGSRYVASLRPGDTCTIRPPMGELRLREGSRESVFVATGTGVAPFLPMLRALADRERAGKVTLYFGCRTRGDDYLRRYLEQLDGRLKLEKLTCISREPGGEGAIHGRVTEQMESLAAGTEAVDYYVSGNPGMVADVCRILRRKGAGSITSENY
ncbi:MAG: FAD-dependent oxidoreductase [Spirochaetia bacterium]|jgi:phytoene dehydrogenase-like protein/NAD(P)H-flavin reductase